MAGEWECYEEPWPRKVYIKVRAVARSCEHGERKNSNEAGNRVTPTSMRIWHSVSNRRQHHDPYSFNGRRASHANFDYLSAAVVEDSINCCHQTCPILAGGVSIFYSKTGGRLNGDPNYTYKERITWAESTNKVDSY